MRRGRLIELFSYLCLWLVRLAYRCSGGHRSRTITLVACRSTVITMQFPLDKYICYYNFINSLTDDDEQPVVTCPDDIIRYVVPGVTSLNVTFPNATATDNSGKASLSQVTPPSGSLFQLGTTGVHYVFEDPSRNIGACICTVSVTVNETAGKMHIIFLTK